MEYRRFPKGESVVSTFEFHEHRERARHLEEGAHRDRLIMARDLVAQFCSGRHMTFVADLGCGDGGLLQLLGEMPTINAHGYDFAPANAAGWTERNVEAYALDFVNELHFVPYVDLYVLTEVLEHLEDPYGLLVSLRERKGALVCSSPWIEHEGSIDGCHNWAWDVEGYTAMLSACGFNVIRSEKVSWSQVHLAVPK